MSKQFGQAKSRRADETAMAAIEPAPQQAAATISRGVPRYEPR